MDIVKTLLRELGIRFSHSFVEKVYTNAPDSNNMYGIQFALSCYGVKTIGVHFDDKEEAGITFPCILHQGNNFVVGIDLNDNLIRYHDGKDFKEEDCSLFNEKWTGDALLVIDKQNAREPGLIRNRITDLYNTIVRYFLITIFMGLGILTILRQGTTDPLTVNVLFDILGGTICFLLFQKQLSYQTGFVDKVCSVLQKGGCDSILESEKAKLFGIVSWTEIGLTYFSSRLLCCFINEHSLMLLQLIGWVAMPYGIWSIWYQAFRAKHWCTLCVFTQIVVWATGIYNIFNFTGFNILIEHILTYAICFAVVYFIIHILSELYSAKKKYHAVNKNFLSFKLQDNILKAAFQESTKIEVSEDDSSIIYGDPSAPITLTVLTNPHCNPCAEMHKRLMRLINETHNIKIQYIYSSFNKELDNSCLFMIAVYQQKPYTEAVKILEEWYNYGRVNTEIFIKKHDVDLQENKVLAEYAKHTGWKEKTDIQATPTIIYSGHELPIYYPVEDLEFI